MGSSVTSIAEAPWWADTSKVRRDMQLTPKQELAVLARGLSREGYSDHQVGHLAIRQNDDTLLVNPHLLGWDEIRASDVLRIDLEGRLLEGNWDVPPAIRLHLAIHSERPELKVSVHNHPLWATVWSATGRIPPAYVQDAAFVADSDIAFFDSYAGTVNSEEAAKENVAALGDASALFLANHGVVVVGETLAWAAHVAVTLELRCRVAWHVEQLPSGRELPEEQRAALARGARPAEGRPGTFEFLARREIRSDPGVLE